ncbi:MAG TPA: hypothetical protein VFX28_05770 [Methylomirabilota bacterium]|nr:hypothetical protein [Methylomirabilota bacterium]
MHFRLVALATLTLLLAATVPALAMGDGKHRNRSDGNSARRTSVRSVASGTAINGTGQSGASTTAATEPIAALAVGLGLLGVRYLRRRS